MSPVQTVTYVSGSDNPESGGSGGIRTHGTLSRTAVFKTAAFNHSATLPLSPFRFSERTCQGGRGISW